LIEKECFPQNASAYLIRLISNKWMCIGRNLVLPVTSKETYLKLNYQTTGHYTPED